MLVYAFHFTMYPALLSALCYCAAVVAQSSVVNQYVATESPIAKVGLLANIGPSGAKSSGAKVGPCALQRIEG